MPADSSLPGSARRPIAGARSVGAPAPTAPVDVTLVLRRRADPPAPGASAVRSHAQIVEALAADPADVTAVREVLTAAGLEVTAVDAASRRVQVRGDVATLERVFGVSLELVESPDP